MRSGGQAKTLVVTAAANANWFSADEAAGLDGEFVILQFLRPNDPPVAYIEGARVAMAAAGWGTAAAMLSTALR